MSLERSDSMLPTNTVDEGPYSNDLTVISEGTEVGEHIGQCKWFSDKLGYGFITVHTGENKDKDVFVHHSGIKPHTSIYKTLRKGEYVALNVVDNGNGLQAVDVTGVGGGTLMCDVNPPPTRNVGLFHHGGTYGGTYNRMNVHHTQDDTTESYLSNRGLKTKVHQFPESLPV